MKNQGRKESKSMVDQGLGCGGRIDSKLSSWLSRRTHEDSNTLLKGRISSYDRFGNHLASIYLH